MEKEINEQLTLITSKIKKLQVRNQRLETENEELRKSVFAYLQQLADQKRDSEQLAQEMRNSMIGQSLGVDKKNLQKELDKYILMLDKCIAAVQANI